MLSGDKGDEVWDSAFNGERSGQGITYLENLNMAEVERESRHGRVITGVRKLCEHSLGTCVDQAQGACQSGLLVS